MPIILFFGALVLPLKKISRWKFIYGSYFFMLKPKVTHGKFDGIERLVEAIAPKSREDYWCNNTPPDCHILANLVDSQVGQFCGVNNPNSLMRRFIQRRASSQRHIG